MNAALCLAFFSSFNFFLNIFFVSFQYVYVRKKTWRGTSSSCWVCMLSQRANMNKYNRFFKLFMCVFIYIQFISPGLLCGNIIEQKNICQIVDTMFCKYIFVHFIQLNFTPVLIKIIFKFIKWKLFLKNSKWWWILFYI